MKICIIHINSSPPALSTLEDSPLRFMRGITPYMDMDVTWDVVKLLGDDLPNIDDYDGFLITGGGAKLIDDELPETTTNLLDFIRRLHDAKKPLVGICWGHQAISKALGGNVSLSPKGYGMGIKSGKIIKALPWMKVGGMSSDDTTPVPDTINLYSMHQCQVDVPPPNAIHFLTSDFCEYGGFAWGNHIFTLQQHPDYNMAVSRAMITKRQDRLTPENLEIALKSLSHPHHTELACQWVGAFFLQHKK